MNSPKTITPAKRPIQLDSLRAGISLRQTSTLINVHKARNSFSVTGNGLCVAVLDTGIRTTHSDFKGRILDQYNFTTENGNNSQDVSDGNGHGTHVAGIIAANNPGKYMGIAPKANIIPLKVLPNNGSGTFEDVEKALQWVIDNHHKHRITAVCMSLGDGQNYKSDSSFKNNGLFKKIKTLKSNKIAVVVAAGNDFYEHGSEQGMGYPAILRDTISVGAVHDAGNVADQIASFSQRLHETLNAQTRTDIFAPGSWLTSSGIGNDHGTSTFEGTSQAAPCIAGITLLLQEYFLRKSGYLPNVDDLIKCLRYGGVIINDGDDEDDDVINTGLDYVRADALGALNYATQHLLDSFINAHGFLQEAA